MKQLLEQKKSLLVAKRGLSVLGGGAAEFDPASIANLAADWRAWKLSLADSDPVASFTDQLGLHDLTSTATARPLYRSIQHDQYGGQATLSFDGVNDVLSNASFALNQPQTLIVVCRTPEASVPGARVIVGGDAPDYINFYLNGLTHNPSVYAEAILASTANALTFWHFYAVTFNGANSKIVVDDAAAVTGDGGSYNRASVVMGAYSNGAAPIKMNLSFALLYSRALTDGEISTIRSGMYGMTRPQIVFDGDSLTSGYGVADGSAYPDQCMALLGGTSAYDYYNLAIPSELITEMTNNAPAFIDVGYTASKSKNIVVIWGGSNDLIAGEAAATVYNNIASYCQARRAAGWKVVVVTILPRNPNSDFFARRASCNTSIRTNWATFADALADVAADPRIGDDGDQDDTTYYQADKTHTNATGAAVVAGIVRSAILTL
jgi:lysophospholipase L1-like esterase